ncbi:DUF2147 domain-containing protein [Rhizobium sp. C1]|uniref:DUF2147 domain-containing protein n=1 Tax=Rhizobium sp. C1 TaxID=1349799 RepID=UPI001E34F61A|nr:DUF2147 domain-containing protein [Rhizobium sp. C1]MCD2178022.1 DUF2147 domain-containing protein [Rhizobium sp. C1]
MLNRSIALTALVLMGAGQAFAAEDGSMKGVWSRGDGNAKVRIESCGSALCATNLWIKPGTPSEKVGDKLIMNVTSSGGGKYEGKAQDPQRGLTYNLQVDVKGSSMTTRGCVLAKIVCKSVSWSRAQ